jgi:hypothetical protein
LFWSGTASISNTAQARGSSNSNTTIQYARGNGTSVYVDVLLSWAAGWNRNSVRTVTQKLDQISLGSGKGTTWWRGQDPTAFTFGTHCTGSWKVRGHGLGALRNCQQNPKDQPALQYQISQLSRTVNLLHSPSVLISHFNKTLLSSHIQGVSFKTKLRNHVLHCKMDTYVGSRACNRFSHPPSWHQMKVSHVARRLLTPVALKLCRYEHGVFTSRTCVHSRTLLQMKSFDALREAFSNTYPVKDVPSKTTIHRLVTTFRGAGSVCVSSGRG